MTAPKQKLSTILNELKEEYLQKMPQKIQLLKNLTARQDWKALEEEYHKLKGTGKTYGFPEISIICEKMEILAQQKQHHTAQMFEPAVELLEKMHLSYLEKKPLALEQDPFVRSLLAMKLK
jgi:HPt (histidine-containing phosphotransfer) domain-containing protein